MQWNGEQHAGFSAIEPWLPISDDFRTANVAAQSEDSRSLLTLYRRLFALRREHPTLVRGRYESLATPDPVLAYRRIADDHQLVIVLNLQGEPQQFESDELKGGRLLLSSYLDREEEEIQGRVDLRASEGVVIAVS
jgi:alpha-glucosidase